MEKPLFEPVLQLYEEKDFSQLHVSEEGEKGSWCRVYKVLGTNNVLKVVHPLKDDPEHVK